MRVGDVAMKGAPESVGLAWMGIRLCMHSVLEDVTTFGLFSGTASDIIGIMISCRVYGKMYGGRSGVQVPEFKETHDKVVDYISAIYYNILEFSYSMSKQMDRNIEVRLLKGLLSSAVAKFRPMIDDIRNCEKRMSEYAQKATNELSIRYHRVGLEKQDAILGNVKTLEQDISAIKDLLM